MMNFYKTRVLTKTATVKVPLDPSVWVDFISQYVAKEHPELVGNKIAVEFDKADPEKGYAFGTVKVSSSQDATKTVALPIVIENFKIYPLDLMLKEGNLAPYNEDEVSRMLFSPNFVNKLVPHPKNMPDAPIVVPFASLNKGASKTTLFEDLGPLTDDKTKKEFLKELKNHPDLLKVAGIKEFFESKYSPMSKTPLAYLSDGKKGYTLAQNIFDGSFEVIEKDASEAEVIQFTEGEASDVPPPLNTPESGPCLVKCGNSIISAYRISKVTDFERVYERPMYVLPEGLYSFSKVAASKFDEAVDVFGPPEGFGMFLFNSKIASVPMTINRVGDDYFANAGTVPMRLIFVPELAYPVKLASELFIPYDAEFIPMRKQIILDEITGLPEESYQYHLIKQGNSFYLGGAARNLSNLSARDVFLHLVSLGCSDKLASKIIKEASSNPNGKTFWSNSPEFACADLQKTADLVDELKESLFDESEDLKATPAVDKVLALSVLTPENLGVFLNHADELEDSISYLSKLLLLCRLGLRDVPESSVKTSLSSLAKLKNILGLIQESVSKEGE